MRGMPRSRSQSSLVRKWFDESLLWKNCNYGPPRRFLSTADPAEIGDGEEFCLIFERQLRLRSLLLPCLCLSSPLVRAQSSTQLRLQIENK